MIGRMSRVMLFAKDVPTLAAFYRDKLGCEILGEITPGWAELKAGGCNIALHKSSKSRNERGGSCSVKLVFGVADVPAGRQELEGNGVSMGAVHSFEDIQMCDGRDPEGNCFQLSSRGM